jgi:hypothetical protein
MNTVDSDNTYREDWSGFVSFPLVFYHVFLPLLLGGFIYILFRSESLLMFKWYHALGTDDLIRDLRIQATPYRHFVPEFILFSFPDGVWVYSLTVVMGGLWHNTSFFSRFFWVSIGPLIGIGSEMGQLLGLVPGTFSYSDLLSCFSATLGALILIKIKGGLGK